ncbi:methyltransferase family protein [Paraburkholderia sp. BL23I1N1]|uniref:class I SAM-dependent methyltransferase n=1 Tax=Paraburkholderia sp. BL23I1N1 TaxID=1938802 RepID=UPI000E71F781|nr:class I SAM-dependent methyltransferase [Paraburkholderia sp. BL23I1N1]RKE39928.1 methyltransferase family protein [Paraburkholderia sp. BL23I1N1]
MCIEVSGTEGYAEHAQSLVKRWQNISFADQHKPVLHLIPEVPSRILDVGSGVGVDAAAFAAMGHTVVAVEPVDPLRAAGIELHPSSRVEWVDDSLPDLAVLLSRKETFDVVMLTAVWMHLDEEQRRRAMPNVTSLVSEGGVVIMSLRHGPVPPGRRMFDVSAEETIELARIEGLQPVLILGTDSIQQVNRNMGVTWTRLAFRPESNPGSGFDVVNKSLMRT